MDQPSNSSPNLGTRTVPLGDGTSVTVRELTLRERFKLPSVTKAEGSDGAILWICSRAVIDWKGRSVDDLDESFRHDVLGTCSKAVLELSGMAKPPEGKG